MSMFNSLQVTISDTFVVIKFMFEIDRGHEFLLIVLAKVSECE